MKRFAVLALAVALLLALGASALAATKVIELDDPYPMYAIKDGVKVYADHSSKADVLKKLSRNEEIQVEKETSDGKWVAFTFKDSKKKEKTGWVLEKYLSNEPVCDHSWGKWTVEVEATCTEEGLRTRKCKKCGLTQSEAMEKTDHTWGKWKVTVEATCTEEGEKYRVCKVCGEEQVKAVKKLPHEYGEWEIVREPTCTKVGLRIRTCEECEHEDEEEIAKLPHEYDDWVVTLAATCTAEGEQVRECQVCGYEDVETIKKLPHSYGGWEILVAATDHSSGRRVKTCRDCGRTEEEIYDPDGTLRKGSRGDAVRQMQQLLADQGYLSAYGVDGSFGGNTERALMMFQKDQNLNPDGVGWPQTQKRLRHDYGPWQTVTPLTRSSDGERVRVCKDCGYEQREVVSAGNVYERWQRGEAIRTIQQMLNDLGYVAGTADGVYGPKLDAAFTAFAAAEGLSFQEGRVMPGDVDALVNGWIAAQPEKWKGKGDKSSPVNLMLTVTPADGGDASGDMLTFDMTLINLGTERCRFDALLLGYGDGHDFGGDNLALTVEGFDLRPNGMNTMKASFSVAREWGEGKLNFCAVAVSDRTGNRWMSNVRSFD